MLASNWRLFIVCPYECYIDYIFGISMRQYLTTGHFDSDRDTETRSGQIYAPRTMVDAMNRIAKIDNGAPNLSRTYAGPWLGCLQPVIFQHHALQSYMSAGIAGVVIKLGLPGCESRRANLAITSDTFLRYDPGAREIHSFW
jgi:hypothetical protein